MKNKGIIILGSPASGKTHFWNELNIDGFQLIDPDIYVEDPKSIYYNNPLGAANIINKIILPNAINEGRNFILSTTGANINTLYKTIDNKRYQFKAIMIYCNPIIAFKRNFSRERRLPKQVLMDLWLKIYSQMDEYINMFGKDNIYVYETEYTEDEAFLVHQYQMLKISATNELKDVNVESSFKKDTTHYTDEQILEKQEKFKNILVEIDMNIQSIECNLYQYFPPKQKLLQELQEWIKI